MGKNINIVYSIFENGEPIFIQNFKYDSVEKAKVDLKNTYESLLKEKKVTNIFFNEEKTELKFLNEGVETHNMSIVA